MVAWRYIVAVMQEQWSDEANLQPFGSGPPVLLYFIDASPNTIYNPLNELFQNPEQA